MSAYSRKIQQMMKNEAFYQLIPVVDYIAKTRTFITEDPALCAFLIGDPTNGTNDEIRNSINTIFKSDYVDGTTFQVSLVNTPDIENQLFGYRAVRKKRMNTSDEQMADAMADAIHDFYREGTSDEINETGFKFRNFELWWVIKSPIAGPTPTADELKNFTKMVDLTVQRLSMFGMEKAAERDYVRRMRVLMNMYDKDGWRNKAPHQEREYRGRPLKEMILAEGKKLDVEIDGVSIKNAYGEEVQYIKPMSITECPETIFYGQMANLVGDWQKGMSGLYEPFMMTLNVVMPEQMKAKKEFETRKTFITNQARGFLLEFVSSLKFQKADFDVVDKEVNEDGARFIKYSMQLTVFAKNKERALAFSEKSKSYFNRMNYKIIDETHFALPFVLSALPMCLSKQFILYSRRFNDATSTLATFLAPTMASWKGNTAYPTLMLASRLGQVMAIDFFQTNSNYNIYLAAISGAGKSFFAGYILNAMMGSGIQIHPNPDGSDLEQFDDGSQCFVVDVGRSYEGIAKQYDHAKFLVFGRDFKYSMNPFPNVVDLFGPDGEMNMIRTILKAMACPSGEVTDLQNAVLLEIITAVWNAKGNDATITDIADECLRHELDEMQRFGRQLRPFTDDGVYGKYFSNEYPPVTYDSRLIVCELEELKSDPHLQVVVLMSLVVSIQKQMFLTGTSKRKVLLIDEGWQYLKEDGNEAKLLMFFAEFLESGWRRFRKVNASGILATQSVLDAYLSPAGRAIIANSAWLLLMLQTEEAIMKLQEQKAYAGSPSDFDMIRSLKTQKPSPGSRNAYSEVFVRFEGMTQIGRLYTDRKLQLILTTTPKEKARRQRFIDQGMSFNQAIEAMLAEESPQSFTDELDW